jgi:hypothetical protein
MEMVAQRGNMNPIFQGSIDKAYAGAGKDASSVDGKCNFFHGLVFPDSCLGEMPCGGIAGAESKA